MSDGTEGLIRAGGCVLWRRAPEPGEGIEIALVYRPKWSDWSHPKGKVKRREDERAAAVREVLEETGMTCVLGPELPSARYEDALDRPKLVRYWAAEAAGGEFTPNREVTRLVWLPPDEAMHQVTRSRDADLVVSLLEALGTAGGTRARAEPSA